MANAAVSGRSFRMTTSFASHAGSWQPLTPRARRLRRPVLLLALVALFAAPGGATNSAAHKQEARLHFEKAEQLREALNGRPANDRTRREYQKVIDAYRKVYYVSPTFGKADASVLAVAELLAEMGRQFQPGDKYLQNAIGQYEFLRKEYPGSKYRIEALFAIGQIYKEDLDDTEAAATTFHEFLRRYPHDQRASEAKQALAELKETKTDRPAETKVAKSAEPAAVFPSPKAEPPGTPMETAAPASLTIPAGEKKSGSALVTGVRHWSSPDSTRVAIDLDGPVEYQAGRVPDPDRIFFDLPDTKLVSTLIGKSFDVRDGFLKKIRVAQYQRGSTRVVLEVEDVSEYSAFLLPNPYRLIIDVHGRQAASEAAKTSTPPSTEKPAAEPDPETGRASRSIVSGNLNQEQKANAVATETKPKSDTGSQSAASQAPAAKTNGARSAATSKAPKKVVVDNDDEDDASNTTASMQSETVPAAPTRSPQAKSASGKQQRGDGESTSNSGNTTLMAKASVPSKGTATGKDPLFADPGDSKGPELKATARPTTAPTAVAVAPRTSEPKKSTKPPSAPTHEAAPTSAGERSLTRALGLKIGRIVIDAGHGGHDTGTIGPTGLMEKDLVLDVALRLGRLLETRLGADVVYTRDDDTFIPLETRTAIANQQEADLFVSVHANSSRDSNARGIETYYLNFTTNADALEVAARENAVSDKSVHELQDLVKKITLKDKIEESRELASDVQQSLYNGVAGKNSTIRNRGVKKAPFVVLIGANMPSILAEISFVSNPVDEKKLETPEYREKIAESLYKGIAKYTGGLSGVKVASKGMKDAGQ